MKLTKKQSILALVVFSPILPIALFSILMKELCYALSILIEGIGYKFGQFDLFIGERYRQLAKKIK
jgi:hypothetical protein